MSWIVSLCLFLATSTTSLAQGLSASTPSKEYIYVGGKLVATDEPAAAQSPIIAISPSPLNFSGVAGGANPSTQSLSITNTGSGSLNWSATSNQSWLTVSPANGTSPSSATVNVNLAGITAGTYNAQLTVACTGASNTPQIVNVTLTVSPATTVPTALLVVGSTTLNSGDATAKTRLEALGYTVTVKSGSASVTGDATGKTLVLISSTVTPSQVNTKFRSVSTPVLNWESDLFDDMGMTASGSSNLGTLTGQTQLSIVTPSHPMAAGLSGTVTVVSASGKFTWGAPNATAVKIATQVGTASKAVIFGYDTGAIMPGLTAPARRVGVFVEDTTAASLNIQGGALFDAAIQWAAGALQAPVGLTATPGNQAVSLQWSAVSGASSYRLKRGSSSSGPFNVVASNLTGTSYTDSNLTNGSAYYYVVTAITGSGIESGNSLVASATPSAPDLTPPSITLSSPSNGATITGTVSLAASASDNVAVSRVRFYLDGAAIGGELTAAPYTMLWSSTTVANGNHTIVAQAWDGANNQASSAVITITVSNAVSTTPVVSVTYPTANSILAGSVSVQGLVDQTSDVQLKVDGVNYGGLVGASSSYSLTLDTRNFANGSHSLAVSARNSSGLTGQSPSVPVTINNPAPSVSVTPNSGMGASQSFGLSATSLFWANDISTLEIQFNTTVNAPSGCVLKYDRVTQLLSLADNSGNWLPSQPLGSGTPLSNSQCSIDLANSSVTEQGPQLNVLTASLAVSFQPSFNGMKSIFMKATDRYQATSGWVEAGSWTPMTGLQWTSPSAGTVFTAPANVTLTATPSGGTVAPLRIEYYQGTNLLGSAAGSPYAFSWTNVAAGSYAITAKAIYSNGGLDTSNPLALTVHPPAALSLAVNPSFIYQGQSSTLSWTSTNATSVTIDQGIGAVALSGNRTVNPTATTTYTATATGPGGTVAANATLTVSPPPVLTLSANPTTVNYNTSTTLTIGYTANICNPPAGIQLLMNGSPLSSFTPAPTMTRVQSLTASSNFQARATCSNGSVFSSPLVNVTVVIPQPQIWANPATVGPANPNYTANWNIPGGTGMDFWLTYSPQLSPPGQMPAGSLIYPQGRPNPGSIQLPNASEWATQAMFWVRGAMSVPPFDTYYCVVNRTCTTTVNFTGGVFTSAAISPNSVRKDTEWATVSWSTTGPVSRVVVRLSNGCSNVGGYCWGSNQPPTGSFQAPFGENNTVYFEAFDAGGNLLGTKTVQQTVY